MIDAIFKYQFLQNAVIASLLVSIVCGMIGVIIVEKKLVMMSGGIAHTAYGGVGLGYLLGFEPIIGAIGFSVLAAFGIGFVNRKGGSASDVIIAMFWSLGMALGIIFIGLVKGYPPNMNSYLFGNILSVTKLDLKLMISMTIIVSTLILVFYNDWKAYLFDEEFATIIGIKTTFLEYLLLVLVALTVVVLIRVAGIILVIALLTAPAAVAGLLSNNFKNRMIYAILIGILVCFIGLWISYLNNIASGATIIIVLVSMYTVTYIIKTLVDKIKKV
ncbi:metal ABC transporter permease [Sedimentibacter sp. zth1]|uniref:metal ABC transporter permease n=1 Tax=Sedimentibacter sp. zth1 TaxID=2816908 RepID=UPI001A90E78E|nr:metal ABC transporter permease [Sedimentibacter sp. zth1]QSX05859.1 metal ABC transporter permease [Sedimentibacter sp. zth1]